MVSSAIASQRPLPVAWVIARSLMTLLVLSGCVGVGAPAIAEPVLRAVPPRIQPTTQLIVKFRDPAFDPAQQGYLKGLARDMGVVTFVYVRPMSGGAHVLGVDEAVDAGHFQRIVEGLAKRPEVEYAEADRRMYPMSK